MTNVMFDETDGIGLSNRLWGKLGMPYGPGFPRTASGNPAIGIYDNFLKVSDTSLEDGYIRLQTATGTVTQIASEASAYGITRLSSLADNDEAVIQLGNGLDVGPFRLLNTDLAFEARIRVNAATIVAGDHGFFLGLVTGGAAGGAIANKLFAATDAMFATINFAGFQHLGAESTALDAAYQASGQTKVDGAVNTDLDTVHTLVAATWVKLGFFFKSQTPRRLIWFVDGVEVASIGESAISAATFPDASTAFMQPTFGARGIDATSAYLDMDWWAVGQLL